MTDLQAARAEFLSSGDDRALPIVDAHHHFWDLSQNPHPWLQTLPRIPFRYGDYSTICKNYLPEDHASAAGSHRIMRSVLREGEWDSRDPVGEARWVQQLSREQSTPHAFAAQIWLDRPDVTPTLAAYQEIPIVRSVRHKPRSTLRESHHAAWSEPGSMRCEVWRSGYAQLHRAGMMFELQTPWWHAPEAVELARDFPQTMIIINHALMPSQRDDESLTAWKLAVEKLANYPNVWMKISGIGVPGQRWTPELQRPVVTHLLNTFGTKRCLFASNHPVDALVADLPTIFSGFKTLTAHLKPNERLALFCDNAAALYRLQ